MKPQAGYDPIKSRFEQAQMSSQVVLVSSILGDVTFCYTRRDSDSLECQAAALGKIIARNTCM